MMDRNVSHYMIQEELGSGAMGVVYRAEGSRLALCAARLYSVRRVGAAVSLPKGAKPATLKLSYFSKMVAARLAAIRDIPLPPARPIVSQVPYTSS
jgi:serine/threonine protein kinase